MAIVAEILHQVNDFLNLQTKEPPVGMLHDGHVAKTSEMEIVSEVKGNILTD